MLRIETEAAKADDGWNHMGSDNVCYGRVDGVSNSYDWFDEYGQLWNGRDCSRTVNKSSLSDFTLSFF